MLTHIKSPKKNLKIDNDDDDVFFPKYVSNILDIINHHLHQHSQQKLKELEAYQL